MGEMVFWRGIIVGDVMEIGFVGTGAMGAPMIGRLAAAFPGKVRLFDQDGDLATKVADETGATSCTSLAQIAALSNIILSCVPDNAIVRDVYLGQDGIASAIRAGSVTIDCSTVGPDATRDVHAGLAKQGVSHLDASMLGSVKQAK